ncbi:uncharacterized protein LOC121246265 [Juglans microcarpa x Juglans regia]|uniref:uncharacterized protein LOC121246265 n=1 Tax=Juglans microcarpa x Juglans regia TaxID=2249226 RepID=UPI001B7DE46B|nr:uncharacterized protein LOC121246265 [Juglans microcarpa x Juglans regia]
MEALVDLNPAVTPEMNSQLTKACSYDGVKCALFEMDPLSSPGPDGFSAGFYQDHWEVVGDGVVEVVKEIFNSMRGLHEINETFIVLIPKKRKPTLSAFVPGRFISNNIIVAYEAMHSMKNRARMRGYMAMKLDMSKAMKLDMSKAYDRIKWPILEAMLLKMGFDKEWTDLIMQCVSSVKYSLLFNEMLDKAERKCHISGYPFARGSLMFNHLFFVDDSLLFYKANALEWSRLFRILKTYEEASGQRLNLEKSAIFFQQEHIS